jgi:hypothetical protein
LKNLTRGNALAYKEAHDFGESIGLGLRFLRTFIFPALTGFVFNKAVSALLNLLSSTKIFFFIGMLIAAD